MLLIGAIIYSYVGPTFLYDCFHLHQTGPAFLRDYPKGYSNLLSANYKWNIVLSIFYLLSI